MAVIDQVLKIKCEKLNLWAANAKNEELPVMKIRTSGLIVSELDKGIWKSKKLEFKKIMMGFIKWPR
jgi:hypothetical protein